MESLVMDKNKASYKLKGMGPIYYINLDDQPERKQYMEDMFSYWEVENYERISAYDGRNDDLSDIIHGRYPENMSSEWISSEQMVTSRARQISAMNSSSCLVKTCPMGLCGLHNMNSVVFTSIASLNPSLSRINFPDDDLSNPTSFRLNPAFAGALRIGGYTGV